MFNFLSALQYFPDRFVRREIQNLPVVCSHSNRGCDWEGKFSEFEVSNSLSLIMSLWLIQSTVTSMIDKWSPFIFARLTRMSVNTTLNSVNTAA